MLLPLLALIVGGAILLWSANKLVDGAASCAFHFGMPSLLVGMLIVGFGTSSPEVLISVIASLEGKSDIVIGNAYGSNISNIALILGCTALLCPIAIHRNIRVREVPILIGLTVIAVIQLIDFRISYWDGVVLLLIFALYIGFLIYDAKKSAQITETEKMVEEIKSHKLSFKQGIFWLITGLLLLIGSSRMLIWGAVEIARLMEISELVIGLTIISLGTSLPELTTSVIAAYKKEHDISVGNIVGSNLFNTFAVVGIGGMISSIPLNSTIIFRDTSLMVGLTILLYLFCLGKGSKIGRVKGTIFLSIYIIYFSYLFISSAA